MRVLRFHYLLLLVAGSCYLPTLSFADAPRSQPLRKSQPTTTTVPGLADLVNPRFRPQVEDVLKNRTLSARATEKDIRAYPKIYDWLLDHPDRTSLAWRRMGVPCVEITEAKPGMYKWVDDKGSELTWQMVGRYADGIIWYAAGKVKPAPMLPAIAVKAVAALRAPRIGDYLDQTADLEPSVEIFVQTDSKAAQAMLRIVGPAAPRIAEQGAEQLLLFFSGPARYIFKHPEEAQSLLAPKGK